MADPDYIYLQTYFLYGDIRGSRHLSPEEGHRMHSKVYGEFSKVGTVIESHSPHMPMFKMLGDGLFGAFGNLNDALGAALMLEENLRLAQSSSGDEFLSLQSRYVISWGELVTLKDEFWFDGPAYRLAKDVDLKLNADLKAQRRFSPIEVAKTSPDDVWSYVKGADVKFEEPRAEEPSQQDMAFINEKLEELFRAEVV